MSQTVLCVSTRVVNRHLDEHVPKGYHLPPKNAGSLLCAELVSLVNMSDRRSRHSTDTSGLSHTSHADDRQIAPGNMGWLILRHT